ncbi:MAG TPA: nucleotide exchange factor GrpE [Candidatus Paceibacterota bacterium]|jgi:molecular chaperone GrpE|nr:nucleotide exchange factor GrpE [Candidatus Paceibacterota bacterium]
MTSREDKEDIDFEPEDELGDTGAAKAKLKKLRDELAQTKKERQEYLDGWQRTKADMINSRQELLRQADRQGQRTIESFIEDLIPALDGFDIAAGSPSWDSVAPEWRSGVDQIKNQLLDTLQRHGVVRFGKVGDTFDHRLHEAVEETEGVPGESGTVFRILRHGYKLGDRIIRPAQVIVKK